MSYVKSRQAELNMTDFSKKNIFMDMIMKGLKGKTDGTVVNEVINLVFSPD